MAFINAVLEDSGFPLIKKVELKNPFNLKKIVFDKESILDIKATDESGKIFNVEVQTSGTGLFNHRTLYYWARLYSSQLHEGDIYSKLYPAICINILDFKLFNDFEKYHSTFMVREKDNPEYFLSEHLVIHFLELPKLKGLEAGKKLTQWLYYLNNEGKEDKIMQILLKENKNIARAHEQYIAFTKDEELMDAYEAHIKWKKDYNTGIFNAKEEGIKEGIEEGIEKGIKTNQEKIAVKMLQKDYKLKIICELTGISIDELQQVQINLKP